MCSQHAEVSRWLEGYVDATLCLSSTSGHTNVHVQANSATYEANNKELSFWIKHTTPCAVHQLRRNGRRLQGYTRNLHLHSQLANPEICLAAVKVLG